MSTTRLPPHRDGHQKVWSQALIAPVPTDHVAGLIVRANVIPREEIAKLLGDSEAIYLNHLNHLNYLPGYVRALRLSQHFD